MSDQRGKPEEPEVLACKVCMTEIPKDLAKSDESSEYVYHYCGKDCYDKWQQQDNED